MNERIWNRSLLFTAAGVTVLSGLSVWLAMTSTTNLAERLVSLALAPVVAAAVVSYSLRIVRFYYFLRNNGVRLSLRATALVQAIGFALSVTPGHIGEVFKLHLIRERAGTPVAETAPLLVLDRLTEGGGFLSLAALSALTLPALRSHLPAPLFDAAGLAAIFVFGVALRRWGGDPGKLLRFLSHVPLWIRFAPHFVNLWRGLRASFAPGQIMGGLALSAVARFADGLVLLFAAQLLGVPLALPAAVFILAVSGLAGGISLLPAGTGAVETTMTGLLVLFGATWSNALAITLLARLATLWLWVALGLLLAFVLRFPVRRLSQVEAGLDDQAMSELK